jgi:FAD/FMN-containing dehydrogenase
MAPRAPRPVKVSPKSPSPASLSTREGELLPKDRLEWVEAWGMASRSMAHVWRPSTIDGVREVFARARRSGRKVALKGGGNSYGDAFQNAEEMVLDLSRMTRVLAWDPATGIIDLEPGVRICDLWRYTIEDGWWPPVVSGTMFTTMGGCLGMNIHGKNAWRVGPFGEHVTEVDLMLPSGEIRRVGRDSDPELFRGVVSGFGMLGVITRIRLQMKRVYSGMLEVKALRARSFHHQVELFEEHAAESDYMVGWADCFSSAPGTVGRGEMHMARHLAKGEDAMPAQSLRVANQELPDSIMGWFPKSILHRFMAPLVNDLGMRMINTAKFYAQYKPGAAKPHRQSHAGFAFLLDYVPNWKNGYRPGGLIQYQPFVPKANAARLFTDIIRLSQRRGITPYLGVTKKHCPDSFLFTHAVDGFSLALDYPVTASNQRALWALCSEMNEKVLAAGGRFYLAKDSVLTPDVLSRYLPEGHLDRFRALKAQCDPDGILTSNMYRRIFGLEKQQASGETRRGIARIA